MLYYQFAPNILHRNANITGTTDWFPRRIHHLFSYINYTFKAEGKIVRISPFAISDLRIIQINMFDKTDAKRV